MMARPYVSAVVVCAIFVCTQAAPKINITPLKLANTTVITTREIPQGTIESRELGRPHHLLVGRCNSADRLFHQENIIVYNDGKSQVAAGIRVNVEAPVSISCVKIHDEIPDGEGGFPKYVAGGPNHNYIEFTVDTNYGKGFHFFIQIYGEEIP